MDVFLPRRAARGAETLASLCVMSSRTRTLLWLLAVAFVVSVVHYVDNYVNYEDYPQPGPGDDLPAPSAGLVGAN